MKTHILLILLIAATNLSFSQPVTKLAEKDSTLLIIPLPGRAIVGKDTSATGKNIKKVFVEVNTAEASNAAITIVQKSKVDVEPDYFTVEEISPDTLGSWSAPLMIKLPLGDYDIVADKEGFRKVLLNIKVDERKEYDIPIKMFSLIYLKQKREEWKTIKWISAAVAAGAGLAAYYFNSRINTYQNDYNNASSASVILDKRDRINKTRPLYKASSGIGFGALGCFAVSWLIELSF
jgi:hypothetical protein